MSRFVNILGIFILSCLASPTLWAETGYGDTKKHNHCSQLHIQIGNASSDACRLVKSNVVHGQLNSYPPAMVYPGMSERFEIHQTIRGPEIRLQYRCNNKNIVISTQQNYCFLKSGNITPRVISADAGITADFTKERGSYYWSKPGFVNWVLAAN